MSDSDSTTTIDTTNNTSTVTINPNINNAGSLAPNVNLIGNDGASSVVVNNTNTDYGALDAARVVNVAAIGSNTAIASGAISGMGAVSVASIAGQTTTSVAAITANNNVATAGYNTVGQVSTAGIASNTVVTSAAIAALSAANTENSNAILSAQRQANNLVREAVVTLGGQNDRLMASLDSSFSQLGDAFHTGLDFVADSTKQLQTATVNAISTVADKNQSEAGLQNQYLQGTLIQLVAIGAAAIVLAIFAFRGSRA